MQQKLIHISDQLTHLPDGKLIYSHNGNSYKWYQSLGGKKQYIHKSNHNLAIQLAAKKYLTLLQEELSHKIKALETSLKVHSFYESRRISFLTEHPAGKFLLPDYFKDNSNQIMKWADAPYEKNPYYTENLIHKTVAGIYVRSKSEALIVSYLYENHIPFHYEEILRLGDAIYYPDFTIIHPRTGEIFYWEHFGRMSEQSYARNAFDKMEDYNSHGIVPSINLITTFEDSKHPLDYEIVQKIIEHYFL